jgi:hypothetical protein
VPEVPVPEVPAFCTVSVTTRDDVACVGVYRGGATFRFELTWAEAEKLMADLDYWLVSHVAQVPEVEPSPEEHLYGVVQAARARLGDARSHP